MKLTITAAAALIGFATAFGPAGAAPVGSLHDVAPAGITGVAPRVAPDGTQVIEVGGRDSGGHRSRNRGGGRDFGRHRGSGRGFGRNRGGGRNFGRHGGGRGYGRYRSGHSGGHGGGHGHHQPYVYGGIALGTYLFLDALNYD